MNRRLLALSDHRSRGFTLIELMVAITAGLFVAISAFALARQGSRFFQQEARVANAQFSATLGFDRLRADIARAGFLTTANVQRDPFRCGSTATWSTPGMPSLAAIRITQATPAVVQDSVNGLAPDQITMTGSYSTVENFPVRNVEITNGKYQVTLQQNNGGVTRANVGGDGGLGTVFKAGRVLRLLDATGRYEFGIIDGASVNASGDSVISLRMSPAIAFRKDLGATCGVEGFGIGMQANVVNTIRYEIRDMKAADLPEYRPLYATSASAPGDEKRYELVRVELDSGSNEMAGTVEIVAEYAVDLRFGLTVATTGGADPILTEFPIGDTKIYDYAFDVAGKPTTPGPERIRAVRARLTVRSREGDRQSGLAAPAGSPPGTIFRYAMGAGGGSFARARALTADIQLANLVSVSW
jgi:prepilin-type N-terminal cleavage/methylation domain-containing protein